MFEREFRDESFRIGLASRLKCYVEPRSEVYFYLGMSVDFRSLRTDIDQAEIAFAESTWLRSRNFWILPVEVLGITPNTTAFGVLKPDMC